ncbi:FAD-dependent oxidoreductase [Nocardia mangyaensis]|uniref:FAD-dependent oxidoreductase n=1 Tax=Nocardia mangyaensis TaxID=2213200 RepID=UPI0034607A7C
MRAVVVGSGMVGLTTAFELLRRGHDVVVVSVDPVSAMTSFLAAAVWFPTAAGPSDRVAVWSAASFTELERFARDGVPGARMCESLAVYRDEPAVPAWSGTVREFRPVRPGGLPPHYRFGSRFAVPLLEMPVFLPWLESQVRRAGAHWVRRAIRRLDELDDLEPDVIVNCAGLRAGPTPHRSPCCTTTATAAPVSRSPTAVPAKWQLSSTRCERRDRRSHPGAGRASDQLTG